MIKAKLQREKGVCCMHSYLLSVRATGVVYLFLSGVKRTARFHLMD